MAGNIPTYRRRELPPGFSGQAGPTGGQISQIAGENLAMGQFGGAFSDMAAKIFSELQQEKDQNDLTETSLGMMQGFSELENKYALDTDPGTVRERWSKEVDALQKKALANKRFSPRVKNQLEGHFGRLRISYGDQIALNARKQMTSQEVADLDRQIHDMTLNQYNDPSTQEALTKLIDQNVKRGSITPEDGERRKARLPAALDSAQIYDYVEQGKFDEARALVKNNKSFLPQERIDINRDIDILERASQTQAKVDTDAFVKGIMKELLDADKLSYPERATLGKAIKLRLVDPANGVTSEEVRVMSNFVDNWMTPAKEGVETDWLKYDEARKKLIPYRKGDIAREEMMKVFTDVSPSLSEVDKRAFGNDIFSIAELESKPDDPRKDPRNTRIIDTLNDPKSRIFFTPPPDKLTEEQRKEYDKLEKAEQDGYREALTAKRIYEIENDYWQWVAQNPDATDEDRENWLNKLYELPKQDVARKWYERMWDAYWATGIEKPAPAKGYLRTATNPKTGERMGYDGTKWEKIP